MLLIVHLTDTHITAKPEDNPILARHQAIAAAVAAAASFKAVTVCLLLVTGDIAQAGLESEYKLASEFIGSLVAAMRQRLPSTPVHILVVPGNHDCDLSNEPQARSLLLQQLAHQAEPADSSVTSIALAPQSAFAKFAASWHGKNPNSCSYDASSLENTYLFQVGEHEVAVLLLNSAWSSRRPEQLATLYPPTLTAAVGGTPALIIAAFHHPFCWYRSAASKQFRMLVEAQTDAIVTGHEHDEDNYSTARTTPPQHNEYIEGMVLQDRRDPNNSGFRAIFVDFETEMLTLQSFEWRGQDFRFAKTADTHPFQRNARRLRSQYRWRKLFLEELNDSGASYTHPRKSDLTLDDIFVFPDFRRPKNDSPSEGTPDVRGTSRDLLKRKRVMIFGDDLSGKTALAQKLTLDSHTFDFIPLLLGGGPLTHRERNVESWVTSAYARQYETPDFESYRQLEKSKRVAIVDDWDGNNLTAKERDEVLAALNAFFDVVVLVCSSQLRFEMMHSAEASGESLEL